MLEVCDTTGVYFRVEMLPLMERMNPGQRSGFCFTGADPAAVNHLQRQTDTLCGPESFHPPDEGNSSCCDHDQKHGWAHAHTHRTHTYQTHTHTKHTRTHGAVYSNQLAWLFFPPGLFFLPLVPDIIYAPQMFHIT